LTPQSQKEREGKQEEERPFFCFSGLCFAITQLARPLHQERLQVKQLSNAKNCQCVLDFSGEGLFPSGFVIFLLSFLKNKCWFDLLGRGRRSRQGLPLVVNVVSC